MQRVRILVLDGVYEVRGVRPGGDGTWISARGKRLPYPAKGTRDPAYDVAGSHPKVLDLATLPVPPEPPRLACGLCTPPPPVPYPIRLVGARRRDPSHPTVVDLRLLLEVVRDAELEGRVWLRVAGSQASRDLRVMLERDGRVALLSGITEEPVASVAVLGEWAMAPATKEAG